MVLLPTITPPCVFLGIQIYRDNVKRGDLRAKVSAVVGVDPQYATPEEDEPPVLVMLVLQNLCMQFRQCTTRTFFIMTNRFRSQHQVLRSHSAKSLMTGHSCSTLTPTEVTIWKSLNEGKDLKGIIAAIQDEYENIPEDLTEDIKNFFDQIVRLEYA
ncbi:PqqD family protein [Methanospirillum lacunae]|uniref:Uncharacterized protein n=2 Tax=Methanospirillum lacunae TaxID=668570 RepID=A0A2V2NCB3_9EURY|nr:hypothetical protein DK846_05180 [Methanospirillum lacunae]